MMRWLGRPELAGCGPQVEARVSREVKMNRTRPGREAVEGYGIEDLSPVRKG
jgi:hypothetical protein